MTAHQAVAFRAAYLLTGSEADAQDATQEGFVRAYQALGRFQAGEPFRPWLMAIVGNEARNRRRAGSRRAGLTGRLAATLGWVARTSAPAPELVVLATEANAELRAAVAGLGEGERRVIACRYLLELSESETAAALGIPAGTVKSRLHRGLRHLRERMGGVD